MAQALLRNRVRLPQPSAFGADRPQASLCKLCDITDWKDPEFAKLASHILAGKEGLSPQHRKLWEFVKVVQALDRHGLLEEDSFGLSVAGGVERVLYYLTRHVGRLVATDIYGIGNFAKLEADERFLSAPQSFAPYEYPQERLLPLFMDALQLKFADNSFDFAFSLSSVEHFGGVKKARAAIQEMGRVVRPGGLVIVTTECSVNGYSLREVFSPSQIAEISKVSGLKLVGDIDWTVADESLEQVLDMHRDNLDALPHINLKAFGSVFTSICLVFEKVASTADSLTRRTFQTAAELDQAVAEFRKLPRVFEADLDRHPLWTRVMGRLKTLQEGLQEQIEKVW